MIVQISNQRHSGPPLFQKGFTGWQFAKAGFYESQVLSRMKSYVLANRLTVCDCSLSLVWLPTVVLIEFVNRIRSCGLNTIDLGAIVDDCSYSQVTSIG